MYHCCRTFFPAPFCIARAPPHYRLRPQQHSIDWMRLATSHSHSTALHCVFPPPMRPIYPASAHPPRPATVYYHHFPSTNPAACLPDDDCSLRSLTPNACCCPHSSLSIAIFLCIHPMPSGVGCQPTALWLALLSALYPPCGHVPHALLSNIPTAHIPSARHGPLLPLCFLPSDHRRSELSPHPMNTAARCRCPTCKFAVS